MIIEKANTEFCQYRIPGLVQTKTGTLIGYYECRRAASDWAHTDLKIIRSTDQGEHWELIKVIPGCGDTLSNPVMVTNGGDIHFLYCRNYARVYHCISTNDGQAFSAAQEISSIFAAGGFPYHVVALGPGHGIVHNNVIIIPVWFAYNPDNPKSHRPSIICTMYSKDSGKSWSLGEIIGKDFFINPSECALGVAKDGRVLISVRNENPIHQRGAALSVNGYSDWRDLRFEQNLIDPVCQGSLDSRNGILYHINCESKTERKNLKIKVSEDLFKTCTSIPVDCEGGYSDIAVSDAEIYVLYERNAGYDGLYFKRIARNGK